MIDKYLDALKTIDSYEPVNIVLHIKDKTFDGVEFTYENDEHGDTEYWLLIHVLSSDDLKFLDNNFYGEKFALFGESCGKEFRFLNKVFDKDYYCEHYKCEGHDHCIEPRLEKTIKIDYI